MTITAYRINAAIFITTLLFSQISTAETFRVMLHAGSFPPYFFEEDNIEKGTIRDIFSAIAEETGDTIEYVRVPFKRALHKFETGSVDIEPMTNPVYRESSSVKGIYTIPYTVAEEIVLFHKDHYTLVEKPEDLFGHSIGVVNGYHYPKYSPYFEDGQIKPLPLKNEHKLIKLLAAERLSQVLINKDFAQYEIKKQNLSEQLILGPSYHVLDMMIRFHPKKKDAVPRFNKAIDKLVKDGTIDKIYQKYR